MIARMISVTGVVSFDFSPLTPVNPYMRIEEDLKLGFKDVLIRPKRFYPQKYVPMSNWNVNSPF